MADAGAITADSIPSRVHVVVIKADDLPSCDWDTGKSDPYVGIRIYSDEGGSKPKKSAKYRTTIKPRELNPEWMEHFNFMDDKSTNMPSVKNGKLVFRIYDHDKIGRDDFIGQGEVSFASVLATPKLELTAKVRLLDKAGHEVVKDSTCPYVHASVLLTFGEDTSGVVKEHNVPERNAFAKFFKNEGVDASYTIKEKLGSGSFAVVKRGIRKADGKNYAIKYIDKTALKKDDEVMLESECAVLKEVHHPNIVKLYEIFNTPKELILVMEMVTGGEMLEKLKETEKYTENDAADAVERVADGLAYLHSKGIAHRDLKPENLLLCADDDEAKVKIADFGFAKMMDEEHHMLQTACGTPEYVAPEVLAQTGYDVECDIWSLGVVMYVMLCGRPPFWDRHQPRLFKKIKEEPVTFPRKWDWDKISPEAKDLIQRMLMKDPKQRITAVNMSKHPWFELMRNEQSVHNLGGSISRLRVGYTGAAEE